MDTNGNGQRDAYTEPNAPADPTRDTRFGGAFYAVAPAPDGSVWGTSVAHGADGFPDVGVAGDQQNRENAVFLAGESEGFESGDAGHADVGDHHLKFL
jgi:hypothetical protein